MKLTNIKSNKSKKGITLIELTVVILVLLSLISVLFIGARAWLRGSDRATAALLIRNAQQGMRSQSNIVGIDTPVSVADGGVAIAYATAWQAANPNGNVANLRPLSQEVFAPGGFVEVTTANLGTPPAHPANGNTFTPGSSDYDTVTPLGVLYMTSTNEPDFFAPPNVQ